jgi:hypothetical protein
VVLVVQWYKDLGVAVHNLVAAAVVDFFWYNASIHKILSQKSVHFYLNQYFEITDEHKVHYV